MAEVWSDIQDEPWYKKRLPMEGRYTFLPLRDTMEGSVFNERQWALPGLLAEAVNAFTAPGRSLLGGNFNPQEEAANVALNVGGGGLLASRAVPSKGGGVDVGMFAGTKAKTADFDKLQQYKMMREQKMPPQDIYKNTGWMQGAEGRAKFEISDDKAVPWQSFVGDIKDLPHASNVNDLISLDLVINHPELFKAYPELKKYGVGFRDDLDSVAGFSPKNKAILLSSKFKDSFVEDQANLKETLLHEIQHAIQSIEGFERGGTAKIANEILSTQEIKDLERFAPDLAQTYDKAYKVARDATKVLYMHSLDNLSKKQNIKPSSVTNMSDWYSYSDKIRSKYGVAPKKPGAERDEWYRNAIDYIKQKNIEADPALANYAKYDEKDLKKLSAKNTNILNRLNADYKELNKVKDKYKNIKTLSDFEKYKRIAGEAEARLTETRANLTPEQRLSKFPFKDLDVPLDEFLFRSLLD